MSERASGEANSHTDSSDKDPSVCPTCGKSGFKSKKYMKIHHNHAHGESLRGEPVNCENCGKQFRKQPNQIEEYDNHLCSNECESEWRSETLRGENSPRYKGGKDTFSCVNCGKQFKKYACAVTNTDRPFCSKKCNNEYWDGRERPDLQKRVTVPCDTCGEPVEKRVSRVERTNNQYCSRECANKGHSTRVSGEGNPRYIDGEYQGGYGPNWDEQARKARNRDNHTCQRCGITTDEIGHNIPVHHKVRFHSFDDYETANRIDNLICLCPSCHPKVESWPVIPQ